MDRESAAHVSRWRQQASWFGRLFALSALAVVVALQVDFKGVGAALSLPMLGAVVAVQPLIFLSYLPVALRFRLLASAPGIRLRDAYGAVLLAMGLNLLIPGRAAELLKAIFLRRHGLPLSQGLAALFLERVADVITLVVLALIGLNLLFFDMNIARLLAILGLALAALMALPALESRLSDVSAKGGVGTRAQALVTQAIVHAARGLRRGPVLRGYLLGSLAWLLWYASGFVFIEAAGAHPLGWQGAFMLLIATSIGGAIPALPGGLGTYEAGAMLVLVHHGYGQSEALILAFALHFGQMGGVLLVAILIAMRYGSGVAELAGELRALRQSGTSAA